MTTTLIITAQLAIIALLLITVRRQGQRIRILRRINDQLGRDQLRPVLVGDTGELHRGAGLP